MQTEVAAIILCCVCDTPDACPKGGCRQDAWAQKEASFQELALYRIPMPVTEILVFVHGDGYPICPRCNMPLDREYMGFCDRCGQRLGWESFRLAKRVLAPRRR